MEKRNKLLIGTSGDAFLLMAIKLVTIALSFAVTRLLSEHLTVHDYGTYSQILLVVSTVSSLTILGMMDGVNYFYGSEKNVQKRESQIASIFAIQCVVSTFAGVVVLLLCVPISWYFQNVDVRNLIAFAAVLPLLQNLLGMLQILLVSVGKAKILALRNFLVSAVRLLVTFAVIYTVRDTSIILWATAIMDIVQIVLFVILLKRNGCHIRVKNIDIKQFGRILSFCAPMAVFTTVSSLNRDLDKYVVALFANTETLAVYTNASKVLPFDIIMTSFCTVLIPQITRRIANGEKEQAAEIYKMFLEISYMTTAILCCAALAASPQLMKLLYSNKYTGGLHVFQIYILVDMLRFTNMTLVLSAAGKTKKLMVLSISSLGMNAVLNAVLFGLLGIEGPAVATLLTTLSLGACILSGAAKELDTHIWKLFDGRRLLFFGLESVLLTWMLYKLQQKLDQVDIHYFLILLIICGIYGLTMVAIHGKRLLRALKDVNTRTAS